MPKIVNFHVPARDPARAARFYADVFGWTFADRSEPNVPYFVAPQGEGGIEFALAPKSQTLPAPVPTFEVEDIDGKMARLSVLGGQQSAVHDLAGIGRFGYAIDCEGNVIALLERVSPKR